MPLAIPVIVARSPVLPPRIARASPVSEVLSVGALALMLLATSPRPAGAEPGVEQLPVAVGATVDFKPGFLPAQVICDDLSVVGVEAAEESFRIQGKQAGATLCGFIALKGPPVRRVIEVVVRRVPR